MHVHTRPVNPIRTAANTIRKPDILVSMPWMIKMNVDSVRLTRRNSRTLKQPTSHSIPKMYTFKASNSVRHPVWRDCQTFAHLSFCDQSEVVHIHKQAFVQPRRPFDLLRQCMSDWANCCCAKGTEQSHYPYSKRFDVVVDVKAQKREEQNKQDKIKHVEDVTKPGNVRHAGVLVAAA